MALQRAFCRPSNDGSTPVINGLPVGGLTDQMLVKVSATDYDVMWTDAADPADVAQLRIDVDANDVEISALRTDVDANTADIAAIGPHNAFSQRMDQDVRVADAVTFGGVSVDTTTPSSAPSGYFSRAGSGSDPTWLLDRDVLVVSCKDPAIVPNLQIAGQGDGNLSFSTSDRRNTANLQWIDALDTIRLINNVESDINLLTRGAGDILLEPGQSGGSVNQLYGDTILPGAKIRADGGTVLAKNGLPPDGDILSLGAERLGLSSMYGLGVGVGGYLYYKSGIAGHLFFTAKNFSASSADYTMFLNSAREIHIPVSIRVGNPIGGNKGAGTINAQAIYDDNALICAPLHMDVSDAMTPAYWDELVTASPEYTTEIRTVQVVAPTVTDRILQWFTLGLRKPTSVVTEEQEVQVVTGEGERKNRTARRFFKMVFEQGFDPRDPRNYTARMDADRAVPGLMTVAEWKERMVDGVTDTASVAERTERAALALDCLAVSYRTTVRELEETKADLTEAEKAFNALSEASELRTQVLEARIEELEGFVVAMRSELDAVKLQISQGTTS